MLKQMLKRMRGTSTTELLIIMPVFLMLTLGALQYSLIYEAKSSLDYATFMSARAGAIDHARKNSITLGLAKSISPLYSPDKNAASLVSTIAKARVDVAAFSRIKILNPTKEAFTDFGVKNTKDNVTEIPNEMLHLASTQLGAKSKLNIQDANLLKVEVLYGYKLKVPFVNKVITTASSWFTRDPIKLLYLSQNRLPILATATVRMQTRAWDNSWVTKTADINKAVVDAATAVQPLPLINIKRPWASGPTGQGTPSQILKGIPGTGSTGPGSGTPGSGTNPTNPPTTTTPPAPQPPKCEGSDAATGWFSGIRNAASFVAGLWDGLVQQIGDIWTALTSPWQTLKGLWALGDGLINNTKATLNMLGDVFGADVYRLLNCGPYDKGKVIGTYVSPSFLIKLAGKLSKLGLADALKQTGKPTTPCTKKASFGAGTVVWTKNGFESIEDLVTGRHVASRNEYDYSDKYQVINKTFGRVAPKYYQLQTEYDVIDVTAEHPLWIQGKGWTVVKDVQAGDVIANAQGDSLVVKNTLVSKPLRVYNFSVANTPNYFVGKHGIWAHNTNCGIKYEQSTGKNKELNKPDPNTVYYVNGRHKYTTDSQGRTQEVTTSIESKDLDTGLRNCYQQKIVGKCGVPGDEGGHLVATRLGGPGEKINLVPQNMNLNRSAWKAMENEWARKAANGSKINVKIEVVYSGTSNRPDKFIVTEVIDGVKQKPKEFINQAGG